MKEKLIFLLIGSLFIGVLSGCAKPEHNISAVEETTTTRVSRIQLQNDQNRQVECTFEIPEDVQGEDVHIAAKVTIPEHVMEQGDYEQRIVSVEQIETVLLAGEKLKKQSSTMGQETWQIASPPESNKAFKINYTIDNSTNKSFYDNTAIKALPDIRYTELNCPTQEMKTQLEVLRTEAQNLFTKFDMNTKILTTTIGEENGYYMADIELASCMDDVPLVESQYGFVRSSCFISNEGVGSIQMHGSYQKKNVKEVDVISVDDMLKILQEKVKNGEVCGWQDVVYTDITLAYYLDSGTENFYPVWFLYSDTSTVYICMNAQTGELLG